MQTSCREELEEVSEGPLRVESGVQTVAQHPGPPAPEGATSVGLHLLYLCQFCVSAGVL